MECMRVYARTMVSTRSGSELSKGVAMVRVLAVPVYTCSLIAVVDTLALRRLTADAHILADLVGLDEGISPEVGAGTAGVSAH